MEDIILFIKTLSENEKIQKLLIETIGKILSKQDNMENFIKENEDKIIHIRDWIFSVVENNEEWKEPRVLTLDALNNAADKYFEKKNNKIKTIEQDEAHERLIADLGEYYVVQMLTPQALDNESKVMQHCIGYGGYDRKLQNKNYQYLSLRDKYNKAHVTLEILEKRILQLQGKQNKLPDQKYLNILLDWLSINKYDLDLNKYDLVLNHNDNKIYSKYNLPDNCRIDGSLDLSYLNIKSLPNNLTVSGYLNLEKVDLQEFPDNLYVEKDIHMYGIEFKHQLIYNINKLINNTNNKLKICDFLTYLIRNRVKIDYSRYNIVLNKNDNKVYSIYDLPDNCRIDGDLNLKYMDIKKIPNNLTVSGCLYIYYCENIKIIPEGLEVGDSLFLYGLNIDNVENIKIKNDLCLYSSKINNISEDIEFSCIYIHEKQLNLLDNIKNVKEYFLYEKQKKFLVQDL